MVVTVTLNPSLDEWVELPRLRVGELNRATPRCGGRRRRADVTRLLSRVRIQVVASR